MMKKSKIIVILLLLFLLVGCGESKNNNSKKDNKNVIKVTSTTNNEEEKKEETEKKDTEKKEEAKKEEEKKDTENKETEKKEEEQKTETKEEKKYTEYKSYDGTISFKFSDDWKKLSKGELNKLAVLEMSGVNEDKFFMVLANSASEFKSYSEWENAALASEAEIYNFDKSMANGVTVKGYTGKVVETTLNIEKIDIFMKIYFLKVKDVYLQIFMWTASSDRNNYYQDFYDIVNTIKYVKG